MNIKIILLGLALIILSVQSSSQQKSKIPNIVFIFSDDLSFRDLSCYGQTNYRTPHLDELANQSTRFTQAYTAAPECAPSRGCMLTGMHAGKSAIRNNSSARGFEYLPASAYTFAEMLKKAGYTNAVIGKWGLGNKNTEGSPLSQGFDYHYGYLSHFEAHSYFPWKLYENGRDVVLKGNEKFDMEFLYAKEDNPKAYDYESMYDANGKLLKPDATTRVYASDLFDEKAMAFIDKQQSGPFFLYFTTNLPHGPAIVDDLRELKNRKDISILSREWGAMVQRLDESVGKLIAKLKAEKLYDNTIIIFASDNGYSMHNTKKDAAGNVTWPDDAGLQNKGPFDGGKFSVREGGMRIPFFIHYPGQTKMQMVTQPVWLLDLFPTFAEIAKQPRPKNIDGYSLLPFLTGRKGSIPYERSFYFFKQNEQSVRKGAWFGIRSAPNKPLRLYLIEEDQGCEKDVAQQYPAVVKELEQVLNISHINHAWYWNPGETQAIFNAKKKKAAETNQLIEEYRPNGMKLMPWEKKNNSEQ
jgi:arylsulfatase A-like enzyme